MNEYWYIENGELKRKEIDRKQKDDDTTKNENRQEGGRMPSFYAKRWCS